MVWANLFCFCYSFCVNYVRCSYFIFSQREIFNSHEAPYCNPKCWVSFHQRVAIIILGVFSPSWPQSHSMSSSCLVKYLFCLFFCLILFQIRKRTLPSSSSLDLLKNLLFNIEYSYFDSRKYLSNELCIATKEEDS